MDIIGINHLHVVEFLVQFVELVWYRTQGMVELHMAATTKGWVVFPKFMKGLSEGLETVRIEFSIFKSVCHDEYPIQNAFDLESVPIEHAAAKLWRHNAVRMLACNNNPIS